MNTTASLDALVLGSIIGGRYRIETLLAAGGMGVVYRASRISLGDLVAVKVLKAEVASNRELLERFRREALVTARLESDHVARVFDVGVLEDGCPFIVMEHLHGETLKQRLMGVGSLSTQSTVDLLLEVCEGLAEAHIAGIVHRDLKPSNLFFSRRAGGQEVVKILDFGISKQLSGEELELTRTSSVLGSPFYMSPEQMIDSKDVDQRSDLWSIGVIGYECLAGATPFFARSTTEVAVRVTNSKPTPLHERCPEVSRGLSEVLAWCLSKKSTERPDSVRTLAEALAPFGSTRGQATVEAIRHLFGGSGQMSPSFVAQVRAPQDSVDRTAAGTASAAEASRSSVRRRTPLARALPWTLGAAVLGVVIWRIEIAAGPPIVGTRTPASVSQKRPDRDAATSALEAQQPTARASAAETRPPILAEAPAAAAVPAPGPARAFVRAKAPEPSSTVPQVAASASSSEAAAGASASPPEADPYARQ